MLSVRSSSTERQTFRLRFKKTLRKRYNFDPERCNTEWEAALRDPKVRKSQDAYGNVTVAKLFTQVLDSGRRVAQANRVSSTGSHEISGAEDLQRLREGR